MVAKVSIVQLPHSETHRMSRKRKRTEGKNLAGSVESHNLMFVGCGESWVELS